MRIENITITMSLTGNFPCFKNHLFALIHKLSYHTEHMGFILRNHSIFFSMLKWVIQDIYPDLPPQISESCKSLASKIFPDEKVHKYNCMLEFHHSLLSRVDLSFYIMSATTSLTSISMPSWWSDYVEKCDHISRASFSAPYDSSKMKKIDKYSKRYDESLPYCLPDCHFLEFDLNGDTVELGGIFQRVEQLDDNIQLDVSCFFEVLDRLPGFTRACSRHELVDLVLKQLTLILGFPVLLGLMVGRGKLIKLIYNGKYITAWQEKSDEHCQSLLQYFSPHFVETFRQIVDTFSCMADINFRLCLDLSLVECLDSPRFCVEVFPLSGVKEARTYELLQLLQDEFKLEQTNVQDVMHLHRSLPKGKRRIPGGPVVLGCEDERVYSIAATLSHYKLEFPIGSSPQLKTYVNVMSETFYT